MNAPATAALAALYLGLSFVVGGVAGHMAGSAAGKKAAVSKVVTVHGARKPRARQSWSELDQAEVDALAAKLKTFAPERRKPVQIICRDRSECGDLALDLENAFETAKWEVAVVAPFTADAVSGIEVSDAAVASAIGGATSLRVSHKPAGPDAEAVAVYLGRP